MIRRLKDYLVDLRNLQQINIAISKGAAMMAARNVDLTRPETWEFSGFSQNGEDGILDVLRSQLFKTNRYVIEIGSADGMQNNSSWLIVAEQYDGLMIDGNQKLVERARRTVKNHSIGADYINLFVDNKNISLIKDLALYSDPDVFSLDIDGVDYYIAEEIFNAGFRPKIFAVEYNSVYGPDRSLTIPNIDGFVFTTAHPTHLYYGTSIAAWRKFFARHGYLFITVDRKGVNAFFVDPSCFNADFINEIIGTEFAENSYQRQKFKGTFEKQFPLIIDQDFKDV
jgi:hypothetical protein